jgi:hypothetical protein
MKTLVLAAIRCSLLFLVPTLTYATSAQWDLDPLSGDWNTPVNWTPDGVPNGPADIATFGLSNTTDVSISADTEVNSIIFTSAATNPYSITVNAGLTLTVSGVGITNNSGMTQNFVTVAGGEIRFTNNATSGSNVSIFNNGDSTTTNFFNRSSAGSAFIENVVGGTTNFFDRSTAGNSTIDTFDGFVTFSDRSSAGTAHLQITDNSFLDFLDHSSAGSALIGTAGVVTFSDSSTAGNATISSAGFLDFVGTSKGGTAQIELGSNPDLLYFGIFDISGHNAPGVTIGSIEDNPALLPGDVFLGANNLTVGSNNLSTTFSGVIHDGVPFGGGGVGG